MKQILLVCSAGMSTSLLVTKMEKAAAHHPALHPANDHDDAHPAYGQHLHRGLREDHADVQPRHV